ncbi:unnamed protein product [Ectocarpus sp. 13 AM-2016]
MGLGRLGRRKNGWSGRALLLLGRFRLTNVLSSRSCSSRLFRPSASSRDQHGSSSCSVMEYAVAKKCKTLPKRRLSASDLGGYCTFSLRCVRRELIRSPCWRGLGYGQA